MTGLELAAISAGEFGEAKFQKWLGETSPELFREYLRPSDEARRTLLSDRFQILFRRGDAEIRLCKRHQDFLAVIGFEHLDWDSRHFGVKCGRLSPYCTSRDLSRQELSEIHREMLSLGVKWARRCKIQLLQRRLLSSRLLEIAVLEDLGFHLVDNVITLAAPIKNILSASQVQKFNLTFRAPANDELGVLIAMTRGAFPYSRFLNDRVLPAPLGDDLYLKWVAKLFGEIEDYAANAFEDDGIIVALVEDRIVGYTAYRIDRESTRIFGLCIATIELIVVHPAYQGAGVGQGLFRETSRILNELEVDLLESSTWMNQQASLASNQKAGLRVRENLFTYHLHL